MRDYAKMLHNGFAMSNELISDQLSRYEWLSDFIFDFDTYEDQAAVLFAKRAVEVCEAINNRTTFEYIRRGPDENLWFLVMCNMPFFRDRITWGTSIRGAFWEYRIDYRTCGLWLGSEQITETLKFTGEEWREFIAAVIDFARSGEVVTDG